MYQIYCEIFLNNDSRLNIGTVYLCLNTCVYIIRDRDKNVERIDVVEIKYLNFLTGKRYPIRQDLIMFLLNILEGRTLSTRGSYGKNHFRLTKVVNFIFQCGV